MPLFALVCLDKKDALEARMGAREAHLAYVDDHVHMVKVAGPFLDAEDKMIGSLFILEADDLIDAKAFAEEDPYAKAGVFESADLRPFRVTRGGLK